MPYMTQPHDSCVACGCTTHLRLSHYVQHCVNSSGLLQERVVLGVVSKVPEHCGGAVLELALEALVFRLDHTNVMNRE